MRRLPQLFSLLCAVLLLGGCSAFRPTPAAAPNLFVLDAKPQVPAATAPRKLVLAVGMPRAQPGFNTPQIAYVQRPYELGYFAANRWVDTPAAMLQPLLAATLTETGGFRSVVRAPGAAVADLRLDSELVRLQQDFRTHPSKVEIALKAQLLDLRSGQVIGSMQFEAEEPAPSEDAYGGVIAANRAMQRILQQLAEFCLRATAAP